MRWGLIPRWSDGPTDKRAGGRLINARVETVWSKPAFGRLVRDPRRRCLVVADGFYEWRKAERPKAPRLAVHFALPDRAPFAFAGLNDVWWPSRDDDGEPLRSCTIIVGPATAPVEAIHDRQPVLLDTPERRAAWLDPSVTEADLGSCWRRCRRAGCSRTRSGPLRQRPRPRGRALPRARRRRGAGRAYVVLSSTARAGTLAAAAAQGRDEAVGLVRRLGRVVVAQQAVVVLEVRRRVSVVAQVEPAVVGDVVGAAEVASTARTIARSACDLPPRRAAGSRSASRSPRRGSARRARCRRRAGSRRSGASRSTMPSRSPPGAIAGGKKVPG